MLAKVDDENRRLNFYIAVFTIGEARCPSFGVELHVRSGHCRSRCLVPFRRTPAIRGSSGTERVGVGCLVSWSISPCLSPTAPDHVHGTVQVLDRTGSSVRSVVGCVTFALDQLQSRIGPIVSRMTQRASGSGPSPKTGSWVARTRQDRIGRVEPAGLLQLGDLRLQQGQLLGRESGSVRAWRGPAAPGSPPRPPRAMLSLPRVALAKSKSTNGATASRAIWRSSSGCKATIASISVCSRPHLRRQPRAPLAVLQWRAGQVVLDALLTVRTDSTLT